METIYGIWGMVAFCGLLTWWTIARDMREEKRKAAAQAQPTT